jgi:hypothetical protein
MISKQLPIDHAKSKCSAYTGGAMLCQESLEDENVEKPHPYIHHHPKTVPPAFEMRFQLHSNGSLNRFTRLFAEFSEILRNKLHTNLERSVKMKSVQVKLLYDYTKFHIGLYAGLITAVTAVLELAKTKEVPVKPGIIGCLGATLLFLVIAGMAGGIIGSTISLNSDAVLNDERIGLFKLCLFKARTWANIEHWSFWAGIWSTILGVVLSR